MIQLVFAHSGLKFGSVDGMPWPRISQDFKNFKARTEGTTLIMGAKTFASLPSKLSGRPHCVVVDPVRDGPVAKNGDTPDFCISINDFERLLKNHLGNDIGQYSIIGGAALLEIALPYTDKVIRTQIYYPTASGTQVTKTLSPEFVNHLEVWGYRKEKHSYLDLEHGSSITEEVLLRDKE